MKSHHEHLRTPIGPSKRAPENNFISRSLPHVPNSINEMESQRVPAIGPRLIGEQRRGTPHLNPLSAENVSFDEANIWDFDHLECLELAQSHDQLYNTKPSVMPQYPVGPAVFPIGQRHKLPIQDRMDIMPICIQDPASMNVHRQQSSYSSILGDRESLTDVECGLLDPIYCRSSSLPVEFPNPTVQAEGLDLPAYQSSSCYLSPPYQSDADRFRETSGIGHGDTFDLGCPRILGEPACSSTRYQGDRFSHSTGSFGHASYYDDKHEVKTNGPPSSWLPHSVQTYPSGQFSSTLSVTGLELQPPGTSRLTQALPLFQASLPIRKTPVSHQAWQPVYTILSQQTPHRGSTAYPADLATDPSDNQRRSSCISYSTISKARCEKDAFLLRSKSVGMSYREIKAKGRFKEAESTLRGRFRTLTKSKDKRVRKPQWQDHDLDLLRKAVEQYSTVQANCPDAQSNVLSTGEIPKSLKIPWKRVAEHVARHGSYHFGNATCRKKWDEINGDSVPSSAGSI